jgi:hypothetical protein
MTKEEIRQTIALIRKNGGELKLNYIPSEYLNDTEELCGLYYGGSPNIEIGKYYRNYSEFIEITDDNLEEVINKIYDVLTDSIKDEFHQAFKNFEWAYEELKYFDDEKENYQKFKDEVLRLKNEKIQSETIVPKRPEIRVIPECSSPKKNKK